MAKTSDVAAVAAVPSSADIERAAEFVREPFLLDGEGPEALAPGTARRRGLDAALAELDAGAENPSIEWRRDFSLLLGLERLLSEEPPTLRDGAELNPHQVDALSGTLAELMAQQQVGGIDGVAGGDGAAAAVAEPDTDESPVPLVADEELDEGDDEDDEDEVDEEPQDWEDRPDEEDEDLVEEAPDDPGAARRFWFEHATGAGKTVAAVGFIDATRTGGVLILTHRRNLVEQFIGEISDRGYKERLRPPLLDGRDDPDGPVTVETYQWFVRNHKKVSDAYSVVICDEAHTALGEKTSACIRDWNGPVYIGMTATGALIARHVADLFPTQTSRFDLAQAARRGVISPLRCLRIPPGPGVRTIAKVPLRKGEVDQDFDQEELAALLDQEPFNVAIADLYRSRFRKVPGVVYTAGVQHAKNVAKAFRAAGINAQAVSGETPKRELAEILAGFERGDVDVLCNAMLLAEGWNSPRATICMHLAPTASRRIYQQRVGRVTRRAPGKEAGLVLDFVHPATTHDETIVTLHSLLDRDVYRGGAIVVGPVRRGRGRKVRVERRIVPVSDVEEKRMEVLERELWRIAVENLDYPEQHAWAALAGARVTTQGWRRARAMLQNDRTKELRRRFLLTCVQRNRNSQLRLKALGEIADLGDPTPSTTRSTSSAPGAARTSGRGRRRCCRRWSTSGSVAATRRRRGSGASPPTPASCTRSTRCSAGRRPSDCSACSSTPAAAPTGATRAGWCTRGANRIGGWRWRCWRRRSRTRPRARRCCAGRGCGWRGNPRRWRAICCATSPKGASDGASASAAAAAARTATRRRARARRPRRRPSIPTAARRRRTAPPGATARARRSRRRKRAANRARANAKRARRTATRRPGQATAGQATGGEVDLAGADREAVPAGGDDD